MSVLGTGIAAGVAQTAHNAQKIARERDRQSKDRADAERAEQLAFQMHLSSAGETRDADEELPDKPTPMYERLWQGRSEEDPSSDPPEDGPDPAAQPDPNQLHLYTPGHQPVSEPLYRHLDVQA